jgi:hypothetical protein
MRLLSTFGVSTHHTKRRVIVDARDSVDRATELGLLRHVAGRKSTLENMEKIRRSFDNLRTLSEEQQHIMEILRATRTSLGHISEMVYGRYGYSWRCDVLMRRMRRLETTERNE